MICVFFTGEDFNSTAIKLMFAADETNNKIAKIPINCDKDIENEEKFDISLMLTNNDPQIRTGRNKAIGIIRDSTGK